MSSFSLVSLQTWQFMIFILQHMRKMSSSHCHSSIEGERNLHLSLQAKIAIFNLPENPQGSPKIKNICHFVLCVYRQRTSIAITYITWSSQVAAVTIIIAESLCQQFNHSIITRLYRRPRQRGTNLLI